MSIPYLHAGKTKLLLQVVKDLDRHEGFREFAYADPLSPLRNKYPNLSWGYKSVRDLAVPPGTNLDLGEPWTVGYGFTEGVNPDSRMNKTQAKRRLEELVLAIDTDLDRTLSWYCGASFETKTVLINMYFNLGRAGLLGFKNTLKYISDKNYKQAAANMLKSLWAKQVGQRARELARRMETQSIPAEYQAPEKL